MTMLKNHILLAVCLTAFCLAALTAGAGETKTSAGTSTDSDRPYLAQMDDERGGHGGPGGPMLGPFGGPGQQRKHLEQLRILKMLELLNLSDEQEMPFLTAFNQVRVAQQALEEKSELLLDSLATELNSPKKSQARLKELIARVKGVERQRFEQITTVVDKLDSLLTTEQIAKLMIFQKRFEMELLEQIGRFRRGPGGPSDSTNFQEP
jgi:hypothetical protein